MDVDVEVETVIAAPLEQVAAYTTDPLNAPDWYRRIHRADWRSEPPLQVGSRFAFEARFLGRTLAYTYEVVDHEPGRLLRMQTSEGPFPMRTTYTWESRGPDSTRMALRNDGQPAGFSRLTAPVMAAAMRRAMNQDLATLRSILEVAASG
jgi:uncharacterized protein YndB with AHSA1/START domain